MLKSFPMFIFLVLVLSIPTAYAASPGGSDGCGIGWRVTKNKTLSATTSRGTTHATLPPSISMTSGISECDYHPIAANDLPAAHYTAINFDLLKHEMAIGSGEILLGLSQIMGCSDSQKFSSMVKDNYARIFSQGADAPLAIFKNVKNLTSPYCRSL